MWLLIDAGNTCTKWLVLDALDPNDLGAFENERVQRHTFADALLVWQSLRGLTAIYVSQVLGQAAIAPLKAWALHAGITLREARPEARYGALTTRYAITQLGVDRWLSALASIHDYPEQNKLMVNVGTAVTIDAINAADVMLGGVILPGYQTMRDGLCRQTAQLRTMHGNIVFPPESTQDAITTGIHYGILGAICQMWDTLTRQDVAWGHAKVLLSGGDAHHLQKTLASEAYPNAPLRGLFFYAIGLTESS